MWVDVVYNVYVKILFFVIDHSKPTNQSVVVTILVGLKKLLLSHLNTRDHTRRIRKITNHKTKKPLNNLLHVKPFKQIRIIENSHVLRSSCSFFFFFLFEETQIFFYFQIFTDLSWLADAIIPVIGDWANAEMTHSWAGIVIHLFSFVFHSSSDCNTFVYPHKFKSFRINSRAWYKIIQKTIQRSYIPGSHQWPRDWDR